jgi:hypothetical protein
MRTPDVSNLAQQYGEGTEFADLAADAPVGRPANGPGVTSGGGPQAGPAMDLSGVTGLGAPTQRPGEPVTAAAPTPLMSDEQMDARNMSPGFVNYLVNRASSSDSTLAFRKFVRNVVAQRGMPQ